MTTCTPVQVGFERILVPVGFTDVSQKAMGYAQAIARGYDSSLVLAGTDDPILNTADRESADLIVLGTQGRTGVSRLLFGSDAESLYRNASCPILVVGPAADPAPANPALWRPRDIVFASDLDPDSVPAAAFAAQLAEEHGAAFTILHVEGAYGNKDRNAYISRFKRAFSDFEPGHREPTYIWRTVLQEHTVGSTITDFASARHSHLIVLSEPAVATQIVAKAPCPVMIVPNR